MALLGWLNEFTGTGRVGMKLSAVILAAAYMRVMSVHSNSWLGLCVACSPGGPLAVRTITLILGHGTGSAIRRMSRSEASFMCGCWSFSRTCVCASISETMG